MTADVKKRIREVLEGAHLMNLATIDESGPWISTLHFVADGSYNIYWMSNDATRHSRAIAADPRAAITISMFDNRGLPNLGVQCAGTVRRADDVPSHIAERYFMRKQRKGFEALTGLRDATAWYVLEPEFIELIDEENFGFKKQKIELR